MSVLLNPYLGFQGDARQAMEFYRDVFGGELTLSTFGEFGAAQDASQNDFIMHAMLTTPDGLVLMASDTAPGMEFRRGTNYSVSLSGGAADGETLRGYWAQLSTGSVIEPLAVAPWGDSFGMCVDRFGTTWLVNIASA